MHEKSSSIKDSYFIFCSFLMHSINSTDKVERTQQAKSPERSLRKREADRTRVTTTTTRQDIQVHGITVNRSDMVLSC
jgi:hypothetical protein